MRNSLLNRSLLRAAAKAVHKDNQKANRYNHVALVIRDNGQRVNTFVFHLDIPDNQFVMTHRGVLARRYLGAKQQYVEITDLRDLSRQGFNTLYTAVRNRKKIKSEQVSPR